MLCSGYVSSDENPRRIQSDDLQLSLPRRLSCADTSAEALECAFEVELEGLHPGSRYLRVMADVDRPEIWAIYEVWLRGNIGEVDRTPL
jgi:hypothetical protein